MCIFSVSFVIFVRDLSILLILFFKEPALHFIDFLCCFSLLNVIDFYSFLCSFFFLFCVYFASLFIDS